jgi:hypothetical protein
MRMQIDTADVGFTVEARALLDQLDDSMVVSLGVLSGVDLCVLGAAVHPVCWEPLNSAWQQLSQKARERLAEISTLRMLHRGLIKDQPPGRGVEALIFPACYQVSSELGIVLGARKSPALVIATHQESRTPPVTYFQAPGTSAIIQEIPERADASSGPARSPLDLMFSYRLSNRAFAAAELARWALKPVPAARYKPKPPRLICFFGRAEGGREVSYQLTVHRNGSKAHIDGPDISADFGRQQLTRFMTDVVTTWSDTHRSLVPPGIDSELHPGGH